MEEAESCAQNIAGHSPGGIAVPIVVHRRDNSILETVSMLYCAVYSDRQSLLGDPASPAA